MILSGGLKRVGDVSNPSDVPRRHTRIRQPGIRPHTDHTNRGVAMGSSPCVAAYQVMRFRLFVVRPPQERRDYESIEVGISGKGTFMDQPT